MNTTQPWASWPAHPAEVPGAPTASSAEREPLNLHEQRYALWKAIQDVAVGNKTDDKLIIAELHKAGFYIAALATRQEAQSETFGQSEFAASHQRLKEALILMIRTHDEPAETLLQEAKEQQWLAKARAALEQAKALS